MKRLIAFSVLAIFAFSGAALSVEKAAGPPRAKEVLPYPLDTCVVSGKALPASPAVMTYKDREIKFCCPGCKPKFEKDPEGYLKKIDAAIIEKEKANYPLDTCVVRGEKLGDQPFDYVYKNHLVRFCCEACVPAFQKEPAKYMKKIEDAAKAKGSQKPANAPGK